MANVKSGRESNRLRDGQKRVLDEASRMRRAKKAIDALEQDNFHDDPHADLVMSKKVPKFNDNLEGRSNRRKKSKNAEYYKQRMRKSLAQMIEDDRENTENGPNYVTAQAPPPNLPDRKFCAVCGLPSTYNCIPCGAKYCSVSCLGTHLDTRCLKWTA